MKKMLFTIILVLAVCMSGSASKKIARGKTHSDFGKYTIEKADKQVLINGKALDAFVITYDNSPVKLTIAMEKDGNCRRYYTLNKDLSVMYVRTPEYFGIQRLATNLEKEGYATNNKHLNRRQYFYQRVIAGSGYGDRGNSMLIAANYPFLVNK